MNNKRGFLLGEETLKIVLALIAIAFLIYFLSSLYFSGIKSRQQEEAEASLEFLLDEISQGREKVNIFNPKGLFFISWPREGIRPRSCSNVGWENCVCITKAESVVGSTLKNLGNMIGLAKEEEQRLADKSDEWVCKESPNVNILNAIKIENPPLKLNVNHGEEITITPA